MNILRKAAGAAASGALLAAAVAPAQANQTILNFGGAQGAVTWSSGAGPNGQLFAGATPGGSTIVDVTAPPAIYETNVTWAFSGDFVAGSAQNLGGGIKTAEFNNGSFSFTGASGNILSGTFTKGLLLSNNGALSFSVGGNNIQYTGGVALDPSLANRGDMSFGLSGVNLGTSGFGISGGNITNQSFSGQASGTLDQSGVPEPGEWAAMGILASGLTGLVLRRRRQG
jgi:hypothetical protein